tara:strand:- start:279 stop:752 length:474 start_codon:yes stop_codon:yes gene_type:complete
MPEPKPTEVQKESEVKDFRLSLNRLNGRSQPIKVKNDLIMSIQAGLGLYSCPRRNVVTEEYTAWEVAFIDKQGKFVQPFCMKHDFDFGYGDQVLPYVETKDVQKMYEIAMNPPESNVYPKEVIVSWEWNDDDEDDEGEKETKKVQPCDCSRCVAIAQ